MNQVFENVSIEAIASCVPSNIIPNTYFEYLFSDKELKLFEKTVGIKGRRWASSDVTALDLGFKAANYLFNESGYDKNRVKGLIFLSQTADYKIPFSSNILQSKLGLDSQIFCVDVNAGCAGFVQGLSLAFSLAQTLNKDEKILLIVSETLSKILSLSDKSTSMLFGDAGSAIMIGQSEKINKSYFNFFSDGSNFDAIIIEAGGYRNPYPKGQGIPKIDNESDNSGINLSLAMDGGRVFDFTLREIHLSILSILEKSGVAISDIDFFLLHQSNKFILKQISNKLGVPIDKVLINIENFGNTSGVSIPLLISTFYKSFTSTKNVVLTGYGSGLNWGNCITDISDSKLFPVITY